MFASIVGGGKIPLHSVGVLHSVPEDGTLKAHYVQARKPAITLGSNRLHSCRSSPQRLFNQVRGFEELTGWQTAVKESFFDLTCFAWIFLLNGGDNDRAFEKDRVEVHEDFVLFHECVLGNEVDGLARATGSVMGVLKMNGRVVTAELVLGSENGREMRSARTPSIITQVPRMIYAIAVYEFGDDGGQMHAKEREDSSLASMESLGAFGVTHESFNVNTEA